MKLMKYYNMEFLKHKPKKQYPPCPFWLIDDPIESKGSSSIERIKHKTYENVEIQEEHVRNYVNRYKDIKDEKDKKAIQIINKPPPKIVETKYSTKICEAMTLSGKKCTFKATCGNYCKKHDINKK